MKQKCTKYTQINSDISYNPEARHGEDMMSAHVQNYLNMQKN